LEDKVQNFNATLLSPLDQLDSAALSPPPQPTRPSQEIPGESQSVDSEDCPSYLKEEVSVGGENVSLIEQQLKQKTVVFPSRGGRKR
jgi:hypothetical protein